MSDDAETRALQAVLVEDEDRAKIEIRSLSLRSRDELRRAALRLAELCEDPETLIPNWSRPG